LTGCVETDVIELHPSETSKIYSICEKYEKPDKLEHLHCNRQKILNFSKKF
jgi:hypothetical protein